MPDFIKLIPKKQSGGNLSQKDKDLLWEFRDKFGADDTKEKYFDYWDFQKGEKELKNYFTSYLNSQGFNRIINNQNKWWKDRHPYKRWLSNPDPASRTQKWFKIARKIKPAIYTMDSYPELSFASPTDRVIFVGRGDSQFPSSESASIYPNAFVLGHEYLHGVSPFQFGGTAEFYEDSAQGEALSENTRTKKGHDSKQDEKHADIWGLKYLFYKEGIYDSRSSKDITIQQVQKLRKKYPKLRPFQQMTDKQIMFMMNHVAENTDNKELPINYLPTT